MQYIQSYISPSEGLCSMCRRNNISGLISVPFITVHFIHFKSIIHMIMHLSLLANFLSDCPHNVMIICLNASNMPSFDNNNIKWLINMTPAAQCCDTVISLSTEEGMPSRCFIIGYHGQSYDKVEGASTTTSIFSKSQWLFPEIPATCLRQRVLTEHISLVLITQTQTAPNQSVVETSKFRPWG